MGWLLFEVVEITNWGARLPQNRFEELWTPSLRIQVFDGRGVYRNLTAGAYTGIWRQGRITVIFPRRGVLKKIPGDLSTRVGLNESPLETRCFLSRGVEHPKPPPSLCKRLCIRARTSITVKNQVEKMCEGAESDILPATNITLFC